MFDISNGVRNMTTPDIGILVRVVRDMVQRGRDIDQALRDIASAYALDKQQIVQIRGLL